MKKFKAGVKKSPFLIIGGLLFPVILVMAGLFWWQVNLKPVSPGQKEKTTVVINKGESIDKISAKLKENGLVRNAFLFKVYLFFSGTVKKIQAGSHHLSPSMDLAEIAQSLAKGANDQWVVIVEGLRHEQIAELLIKNGFAINPQEWEKEVAGNLLEGRLFPDSYLFPREATQAAILNIINRNFQKRVETGLAGEIKASGFSLNQILTIASIVERESRIEVDRKLVAGILLKRLGKSWPLQTDATVQYVVASLRCRKSYNPNCEWWPAGLTRTDLQIASPYNTYLSASLPPAPICNPGLSAIKAVLNPQDSPYWFYISDRQGVMHYAKTAEEHALNIQKYLR